MNKKPKEVENIKLKVKGTSISMPKNKKNNFMSWLRETSKKEGIKEGELLYGDALYEEVF